MYDKLSSKAEEFIDHDEIIASINWADEHKNQKALIDGIIEIASDYKGLSHREAHPLGFRLVMEIDEK
jgi:2-iminoacetate synthase